MWRVMGCLISLFAGSWLHTAQPAEHVAVGWQSACQATGGLVHQGADQERSINTCLVWMRGVFAAGAQQLA